VTLHSSAQGQAVHAGPAVDEFDLVVQEGHRKEIAGPFYYEEQQELQRIWAVPPVLSYTKDPATDLRELTVLYPLFSYINYGGQYRVHLGQLISFAGGATQTESVRNRFTLFPLYFQQRSDNPSENYTAYGPFYGHLKHRLFRDEIFYVMFPGYSQTRKRDVVTWNYLYPFFHLREGNGLKGWQFWPLLGHEHKDVTTKTNAFGDVERIGGHDRRFVLWPIFGKQSTGLGTENPQREEALLPAYHYLRSPLRDSTTVLWPFFTVIDDREKKYHEWQGPWPFIDFAHGEGKTIKRVWPFYSHAFSTNIQSDTILWPLYKYSRIRAQPLDRRRTRIAFFLYSNLSEKDTQTGQTRGRIDLWPLFTHRRELNGNTRLQILAPVEPVIAANHSIEREYSPIWSLWRAEKNPKTGASSQSLLWNLYRREASPEHSRTSFLFGLYQHERSATGKHTRVCYVKLK
jgi:hypothetical protein